MDADKTQTHAYECVYIYVYIVMYLYAHVWFYAQFPPGNSLGKWIHWVFTELRAVSPDSWNLSSWRDCCDVAGLLLLCYPFPFYQSSCLLLRSPRAAWELQFPRSRINPDALFFVGITCQSSFFCSNIRKIKHFIYYVGMFQSKVKGWL